MEVTRRTATVAMLLVARSALACAETSNDRVLGVPFRRLKTFAETGRPE